MTTPVNAIEAEIQRATEKLRRVAKMRPDAASGYCREIIEYEKALRTERQSRQAREARERRLQPTTFNREDVR
jgi:hypothetical protein